MFKSIRRAMAAAVAMAALATLTFAAPAAQAADPRSPFPILTYGQSYAVGWIRWHARSVDVDYNIKAHQCLLLQATTYNARGDYMSTNNSWWVCNDKSDTFNVWANAPGGAASVYITIFIDDDDKPRLVDEGWSYRP
ncbi:hypothetical protein ABZX92_44170 [Lentzea sp. NPDC006480]|uniref:hypothetical protein n=1 Tax=Lentzea sp. NPDC006480 TaxID=3157176 RepID=UPI0033AB7055